MVYRLKIKQEAKQEITAAFQYYESQKEGLGATFITYLDHCVCGFYTHRNLEAKP